MKTLPKINVRGANKPIIFVQGGMGAGVSLIRLPVAVALRGGVGTVSSVALDRIVSQLIGEDMIGQHKRAAEEAIKLAKKLANGGFIAINCMHLLPTKKGSVEGAVAGGVDAIIIGAGIDRTLPKEVVEALPEGFSTADVLLIPIVTSVEVLKVIFKSWARYRKPDAVIVEGPLAGGHLGFKYEDIEKEEFKLENIFPPIKEFAVKNGDFPVIVAGGIYFREDIVYWINVMGADGVQMATRFLASRESDASETCKKAVVACTKDDIFVSPGSPCGMPFRVLRTSPVFKEERENVCDKCYLLRRDKEGQIFCPAVRESNIFFCICNALLSTAECNDNPNEPEIYTVGARAYLVDRIMSVNELMDELTGISEV